MIIENLSPDGLTPLWKKSQLELVRNANRAVGRKPTATDATWRRNRS